MLFLGGVSGSFLIFLYYYYLGGEASYFYGAALLASRFARITVYCVGFRCDDSTFLFLDG